MKVVIKRKDSRIDTTKANDGTGIAGIGIHDDVFNTSSDWASSNLAIEYFFTL